MGTTLGGYSIRETPARSLPAEDNNLPRKATHMPQPVHRLLMTLATVGEWNNLSWESIVMALAAAPLAWATASGISLGAWAAPAKKIPDVTLSTGRSLGWASAKKPSLSTAPLRFLASFWDPVCGR